MPNTVEEWEQVANDFAVRWNFPNCFGAMDGKHIIMQCPAHGGSTYFNYKGTHSIVLMALVDANYKFLYIDVGCNGRIADGGVFSNCSLSTALEQNALNLPAPRPLPSRTSPVPYVIVADDAFPLKPYIMKPYPFRNQPMAKRVFNYRLSRAQRMESAFGILAARFRVLRSPICLVVLFSNK